MSKRNNGRRKNPVINTPCRHCNQLGLRYQGTSTKTSLKGTPTVTAVYRCDHCKRQNSNPGQAPKPSQAAQARQHGPLCPYHDIPIAHLQLAKRITTMPWTTP